MAVSRPESIGVARGMRRGISSLKRWAGSGSLLAILGLLIVYPIGMLLYASFLDEPPRPGSVTGDITLEHYQGLLSPSNLEAFRNSAIVGIGGTLIALVIGATLAWLSARTDVAGRPIVQIAGIAPLFMSALVGALAWSILASPRAGYINMFFRDVGIPFTFNIYSLYGITFVLGLYYVPYVFLFVQSALTLMNPELEEAAEVHGASKRGVLTSTTFPLVKPALLSAAGLTLVLILENFPVPQVLGSGQGSIVVVPSQIFRLMRTAPSRPNEASALGMMLLALMVLLIGLQRLILRNREFTTVTGKGFRPRRVTLGKWRWAGMGVAVGYLLLSVGLPLFALIQTAARRSMFIPNTGALFDFSTFNLESLRSLLGSSGFRLAIKNTIILGIATAILAGLLHGTLSYVVHRTKVPGRRLMEYITMTPAAVPALVVGLGFLWAWLPLPVPIYGTLAILILAYTARFAPQGYSAISSSMRQVHADLEESARVSGATRVRSVREVTLPLIRSGVFSMMVLLFVLSMRELSASIFLFTSDTRVMSVLLFEQWEGGALSKVAWIALIYSAMLFSVAIVGRRWLSPKDL